MLWQLASYVKYTENILVDFENTCKYQCKLVDCVYYLLISSLPEDSQSEDSGDRRSKVARNGLDVDVQLAAVGRL